MVQYLFLNYPDFFVFILTVISVCFNLKCGMWALSIPEQWENTLLDKFRYLQSCMCQKISYVHWFEEMMFC